MKKIMFICHGNICRSPTAEFVFKDLVKKAGLEDEFFITSAATSTDEIFNGVGNEVYPPARAELARHGIDCSGKRAVWLQPGDYDTYDLLICMDDYNIKNTYRRIGSDPLGKVKKLMSFAGKNADVADPWFSRRFDIAYQDIYEGCTALLSELKEKL